MPTTPAQDEFLAITRKSQEAVITAIKAWVETVKTASPRLSPLKDKLPKVPSFTLPLADRLPGREETVANAYHLAEQMLANQRKFAEDLLKLMTPLIPGRAESAPVSSAPESAPASPVSAKAPASPAAKSKPAGQAAKTTTARPAPKGAAAKSTSASAAAKSTAARPAPKSATTKSTAARRAPKSAAAKSTQARPAPKGTAG